MQLQIMFLSTYIWQWGFFFNKNIMRIAILHNSKAMKFIMQYATNCRNYFFMKPKMLVGVIKKMVGATTDK